MGLYVVTSTGKYKVKTVVRGIMKAYVEYGSYEPIQEIGMYVVGKVKKGISYVDALHQVS